MNRAESSDRLTEEIRESPTLQAALAQLLEALRLAESSGRPQKEFAVELAGLIHGGTTAPALKWMVLGNLAHHVQAGQTLGNGSAPSSTLEFSDGSRFMLTDQGLALAGVLANDGSFMGPGRGLDLPQWRHADSELWYLGRRLLRIRARARFQILLMESFEEEHWQRRILDPLPGGHPDPQKRLLNVLYKLNSALFERLLAFHADGKCGITWEPTGPKSTPK